MPPSSDEDIVRVKTELVQTDVSVVDRRGRFIEGLSLDQFQLRADGKPQPLLFFDQITTGTANEEKQLIAARNAKPGIATTPTAGANVEAARGRTIFFFVDDVHLAGDSLTRARALLARFGAYKSTTIRRRAPDATLSSLFQIVSWSIEKGPMALR